MTMDAEMKEFIRITAERLLSQDNRITSEPVFGVYVKRHQYFPDDNGYSDGDSVVWRTEDGEYEATEEDKLKLDALYEKTLDGTQELEDVRYDRCVKFMHDEFVQSFFTQAAAEEFMRRHGHNLREPFIYVSSGYRSKEWVMLRKLLVALPEYLDEMNRPSSLEMGS